MLKKLEINFNIKNNALKLIKSYLQDRTFCVNVKNHLSSPKKLNFGVPQGSLLGPIFYILYIHELEKIAIKHGFKIQIYADDCQLYTSFVNDNITNVESTLKACLDEINNWMSNNYLMLNTDKTLIKIFWNKKSQLDINKFSDFKLNSMVRVLGVNIDGCFTFDSFIANKVRTCSMHLKNLYNIRESLDFQTRILLITNLILSTIDYCNIILIGCSDLALRPLKLIINRSIRFIFNHIKFRQHISPFYDQLHFLPIRKRIIFKTCLLGYKIFYRVAPVYLEEKVQRFTPTITHMELREGSGRDPYMFETSLHKKNSIMDMMKLEWNKLPLNLRKCMTITTFKTKLKTHLMSQK